LRHSD